MNPCSSPWHHQHTQSRRSINAIGPYCGNFTLTNIKIRSITCPDCTGSASLASKPSQLQTLNQVLERRCCRQHAALALNMQQLRL
jgi:hypothetical protein